MRQLTHVGFMARTNVRLVMLLYFN